MITITIHPQTPAHIAVLAEAMTKLVTDTDQATPDTSEAVAHEQAQEKAAPKATRARKSNATGATEPASTSTPAPAAAAPAQETEPAAAEEGNAVAEPSTQEATAAPTASSAAPASSGEFTLEIVRAKLAGLSQAGKADKVKGLIAQFGAAKLTDLKVEQYGDLMAQAEAL